MDDLASLITITRKSKPTCKGLIFRGRVNKYLHGGKYVEQYSMNLLKRKSCGGCEECGYLMNDLHEFSLDGNVIMPQIKDGSLYKLEVTNIYKDWETGYIDSWDLEFVEYEGDL